MEEKAIAEYSVTTAALAKLKEELAGKVYAVDNATGMALAKFDRRGLVTLRTDLEKKRIEIKAPALERCKLIDSEANRIKADLLALEQPIDAQIKAQEAIEEAKRAEKARIAAEAQAKLDAMIIEIGRLPLLCIGKTSDEITVFLAALEARPFGGEFSGDTLVRAESAKVEAIEAIKKQLAGTIWEEEKAAAIKAEQEAETARLEAEKVEREAAEKIRREEMAAQQAELDEQKRLQDIEAARLKEIADAEAAKMAAERAVFEAEKAEVARKQAEDNRIAAEKQAIIDAENKRIADEAAAAQRELDRQAAITAEQNRIEADKARKVAEKKAKLLAARCENAEVALVKILDICRDDSLDGCDALAHIALIAEASI